MFVVVGNVEMRRDGLGGDEIDLNSGEESLPWPAFQNRHKAGVTSRPCDFQHLFCIGRGNTVVVLTHGRGFIFGIGRISSLHV